MPFFMASIAPTCRWGVSAVLPFCGWFDNVAMLILGHGPQRHTQLPPLSTAHYRDLEEDLLTHTCEDKPDNRCRFVSCGRSLAKFNSIRKLRLTETDDWSGLSTHSTNGRNMNWVFELFLSFDAEETEPFHANAFFLVLLDVFDCGYEHLSIYTTHSHCQILYWIFGTVMLVFVLCQKAIRRRLSH